jgi:hypothetical protein
MAFRSTSSTLVSSGFISARIIARWWWHYLRIERVSAGGMGGGTPAARANSRLDLSLNGCVKTTRYFELRIKDRPGVLRNWCERVLHHAERVEQQGDGKYQMWGYIAEMDRYLRVITLEDRETVDNAFFDRGYARKLRRS